MSRIIQRSLNAMPDTVIGGDGIRLHLASGQTVIDGSGGAAVACIGHGNKRVAAAMAEQAGRVAYAHTGFFTCEPAEALADILLEEEPGGLTHAFFVSSRCRPASPIITRRRTKATHSMSLGSRPN